VGFSVFLALLVLSSLQGNVFAQYSLPEYNRTVAYVNTLTNTYNSLLKNSTYYNRPDFNALKGNFSLYHEADKSFRVVVLQPAPHSNFVAFMFVRIRGTQPSVTMDYKDTLSTLVPAFYTGEGEDILLENNIIQYGNVVVPVPAMFIVFSTDISSSDYLVKSKSSAQWIFEQDVRMVSTPQSYSVTITDQLGITDHAQTIQTPTDSHFIPDYVTTTTVTTTATVTAPPVTSTQTLIAVTSTQDQFAWFTDNPIVKIIVTFFGSVLGFAILIVTIIILVSRKQVRRELKKLLRMD
jgi:hypothetical protein